MKNLLKIFSIVVFFLLVFNSCKKVDTTNDVPNCVEKQIQKIQNASVQNPPAKVCEWKDDEDIYYLITSDCCDQFDYLYDDKCKVVCAPSGGFTGAGDGNCPTFKGAVEKTLVWEDPRE